MQNQSDDGNRHLTCLEFEHNLWSTQLLIPAPTDSKATKSMMWWQHSYTLTHSIEFHFPILAPTDSNTTKSIKVGLKRDSSTYSRLNFSQYLQTTLDPTYSKTTISKMLMTTMTDWNRSQWLNFCSNSNWFKSNIIDDDDDINYMQR
jgi:hypothetical protein